MSELLDNDPQDSGRRELQQKIEEAKAKLPLPDLVRRIVGGVDLSKLYCPYHIDKTSPISVRRAEDGDWQWECSAGCGEGDEIDFLAFWNDLETREATLEYLLMAEEVGNEDKKEENASDQFAHAEDHDPYEIRRARSYVAKMPPAIANEGGHNRLFAVVCVLVQKFELTADEIWEVVLEYNWRCEPPWNKPELIHKLRDAYLTIGKEVSEEDLDADLDFPKLIILGRPKVKERLRDTTRVRGTRKGHFLS